MPSRVICLWYSKRYRQSLLIRAASDQFLENQLKLDENVRFPESCKHFSIQNQQHRQQKMRKKKVRSDHLLSTELSPWLLISAGALITEACLKSCREIVGKGFPADPSATTKHYLAPLGPTGCAHTHGLSILPPKSSLPRKALSPFFWLPNHISGEPARWMTLQMRH